VLAEKKANPKSRFAQSKALKELGPHPESKAVVKVMSGRYGPYITDGDINANVPKGSDPQSVTLEQAVELLRARAEMGGGKKKKKKPAKVPAKAAKANGEAKAGAKPAKAAKAAKAETKDKPKPAAPKKAPTKKKVLEET
jgi:DNA topoisomerase-1